MEAVEEQEMIQRAKVGQVDLWRALSTLVASDPSVAASGSGTRELRGPNSRSGATREASQSTRIPQSNSPADDVMAARL